VSLRPLLTAKCEKYIFEILNRKQCFFAAASFDTNFHFCLFKAADWMSLNGRQMNTTTAFDFFFFYITIFATCQYTSPHDAGFQR
jgi:hypothetical protein